MIELAVVFFEVVGEFLITIIIEIIGDAFFWFIPEKSSSKFYKFFIGWLFAFVGLILGGVSTIAIPNLLIHSEILQILNIVLTPILVGILLSHWGKSRAMKEKRIGKIDKFYYGYTFALMITLSRFIFTRTI
jgi:hypothetical protein